MKNIAFALICLVFYSLPCAQVEGAETIFKPMSDDKYNTFAIKDWSYDMKKQYGSDAFHWQGEGFYIAQEIYNKQDQLGIGLAFLPVNSQFLTSRFIMSYPCFAGPDMYDCYDWY